MRGHPLVWLGSHLENRPGVTVHYNDALIEVGMRGKPPIYIGWNARAGTSAWNRGGRRPGEGEPLMADPALAAEQIMMLLEEPPPAWPKPKPWWSDVR